MEKSILQKNWIKWVSTGLVLAIMVAIFVFSSHGQETSEGLSDPFANVVQDTGALDSQVFEGVREQYAENGEDFFQFARRLVRKLAHVAIFMALGGALFVCIESWFGERKLNWVWSSLAGIVYAASDEWHQSMVPGRSGSWEDVGLDAAGVVAGVLVVMLIVWLIKKRKEKKLTAKMENN